MPSLNDYMKQYMLNNSENLTYGDILNSDKGDIDSFFNKDQKEEYDKIIEGDRQRLLRFS